MAGSQAIDPRRCASQVPRVSDHVGCWRTPGSWQSPQFNSTQEIGSGIVFGCEATGGPCMNPWQRFLQEMTDESLWQACKECGMVAPRIRGRCWECRDGLWLA